MHESLTSTFAEEGLIFVRDNRLATNTANAALFYLTRAQSPALGLASLLWHTARSFEISAASFRLSTALPSSEEPDISLSTYLSLLQGSRDPVVENVCEVTKGRTLLAITQVSSGLKQLLILIFSKYKYFDVKIASSANVKFCVTIGPIH